MNILIVGNHCCSNRGDAAILRGLLDYLEEKFGDRLVKVDFTSRYVDVAKWMFNKEVLIDTLYSSAHSRKGLKQRVSNYIYDKYLFPLYCSGSFLGKFVAPRYYKEFSEELTKYDLVIQVGGSFFVDLYGAKQFEAAAICINEDVPVVMLGHSVGPFKLNRVDAIAKSVFKNCNGLVLREKLSEEHLIEIGLSENDFINGADTAWLINPEKYKSSRKPFYDGSIYSRPCIAITTRILSPFDKRLGITQTEYEVKLASLCSYLIDQGYNILAASTCTGLDAYHRDDRITALRIGNLVNRPENYLTLMDEMTDIELGQILGDCVLTIGTRLHSAILSKRFGTPSFAISYEHKSTGILEQMQLSEYSVDIHDINSDSFIARLNKTLENIELERERVSKSVDSEAQKCKDILDEILTPLIMR